MSSTKQRSRGGLQTATAILLASCLAGRGAFAQTQASPAPEPPPAEQPAAPASPDAPLPQTPPAPQAAAPLDANGWLHKAEGQTRLNRVIDAQLQEVREQTAHHREDRAARAYAVAYSFNPAHGLLLKTARAYQDAKKPAEALILYDRLLAENPEPLLRAQATALKQDLKSQSGLDNVDTDQLVRSYIEHGKEAFHKAEYQESIADYATAYALQDLPRLLFNIAQSYRRLGLVERAYLMYQRYLQSDPETALRRETEGYISELRLLTVLEGPQREPRPKWRIAVGASALGVGLALLSGGAAALAVNGQCAAPDAMGRCSPNLDDSGRPILPRTAQIYSTTALGAGLIAGGGVLAAAGTVLMAIPGKRIQAQATASFGPDMARLDLQAHF